MGRGSQGVTGMTDSLQRAGYVAVRDLPPPSQTSAHHHHHSNALPSPQIRHHYGKIASDTRDVTPSCVGGRLLGLGLPFN